MKFNSLIFNEFSYLKENIIELRSYLLIEYIYFFTIIESYIYYLIKYII